MSQPQKPPGNRPSNARVFRPFTGAPMPGQGTPATSPPSAGAMRRSGQPFKPFVGTQRVAATPQETPSQPPPAIAAVTLAEPEAAVHEPPIESIELPAPAYHEPEPAPIAHEAWEKYVALLPEELVAPQEPIPSQSIAEPHSSPEITVEVPQLEVFEAEPEGEVAVESGSDQRKPAPITVEVPAILSEEAMAAIRDVSTEGDLWETAYSAAAPISEPPVDTVNDEVEAAFSESAASISSDSAHLEQILVAAATLESLASQLRNGEIDLRPAPGANMSSEEAALATVLAALLANR